jgi:iron complex outermembrane receptor protein
VKLKPSSPARDLVAANIALAVMTAIASAPVSAQNPPADDGGVGIEEVVVTAERYGATVQTTPVAVTAVTGEQLAERQVSNVLQAAAEIPGIMITPTQGSNTSARIALRGVNQSTAGINFDPAVGIYIDGVYQPRINGAFFEFFDLDRLEVLRGPQGTLYGRNSSAGAIKIETKKPSNQWTGGAELNAGNFNAKGGKGYISGPLIDDVLAFSASAVLRKHDGYIYGINYGRRIGDIDTRAERVKLLYTPFENFSAELAVFAIQDYSESGIAVPLRVLPGVRDPYVTNSYERDYSFTEIVGPIGQGFINNTGAALNLRYQLTDAIELASITGYGNQRTFSLGNTLFVTAAQQAAFDAGDNTVIANSTNEGRTSDEFVTQEFTGTYATEKWKAVGGVYYINEKGKSRAAAAGSSTIDQDRNTEATAIFGQATYTIGAGVGVTAGLRYTREEADFTQFYRQIVNFSQNATKTFTSTTPKLGINWQANENLLLYTSYTKGFKSGGFNPIPPNSNIGIPGAIAAPTPYNPEGVESYEAGFKWTTWENRARLNATTYRAEYEGLQLPVFFPGTTTIYTANATGAVVRGLEVEAALKPMKGLEFYGNWSITHGAYNGPYTCANQFSVFVDCSKNRLVGLIPSSMLLGAHLTPVLPVPGQFKFNFSWAYHSSYFNNSANSGPLVRTPNAGIYNAGVSWASPNEQLAVAFDVRNVADKHYSRAGLQQSNPTSPAVSAYPNDPRNYLLRLQYSF